MISNVPVRSCSANFDPSCATSGMSVEAVLITLKWCSLPMNKFELV